MIVDTKNNRSFRIIKNLPFNTQDYTDVVIVLKQNFTSSFFLRNTYSRQDNIVKNIVFKYHFCTIGIENKTRIKPNTIGMPSNSMSLYDNNFFCT
jgi:hypothetical protein